MAEKANDLKNAETLVSAVSRASAAGISVKHFDYTLLDTGDDYSAAGAVISVLETKAAEHLDAIKAQLVALGVDVNR